MKNDTEIDHMWNPFFEKKTLSAASIEKPKTNDTFGLSDPKLGIFF